MPYFSAQMWSEAAKTRLLTRAARKRVYVFMHLPSRDREGAVFCAEK
jgi:hypothetical protein